MADKSFAKIQKSCDNIGEKIRKLLVMLENDKYISQEEKEQAKKLAGEWTTLQKMLAQNNLGRIL